MGSPAFSGWWPACVSAGVEGGAVGNSPCRRDGGRPGKLFLLCGSLGPPRAPLESSSGLGSPGRPGAHAPGGGQGLGPPSLHPGSRLCRGGAGDSPQTAAAPAVEGWFPQGWAASRAGFLVRGSGWRRGEDGLSEGAHWELPAFCLCSLPGDKKSSPPPATTAKSQFSLRRRQALRGKSSPVPRRTPSKGLMQVTRHRLCCPPPGRAHLPGKEGTTQRRGSGRLALAVPGL